MSSFRNIRINTVSVVPFCKVCKDAGKSEKEYSSHFVKSEPGTSGKVVCPTLLSLECNYCHGSAHTVKYCKVLLAHTKQRERELKREKYLDQKECKVKEKKKVQPLNPFQLLEEDSDSDSDSESESESEMDKKYTSLYENSLYDNYYPKLSEKCENVIASRYIQSYANVLTAPEMTKSKEIVHKPSSVKKVTPLNKGSINWADDSMDSDEEFDALGFGNKNSSHVVPIEEEYVGSDAW